MVAEEIWLDAKSQSSPGVSRRELLLTTAITLIFSTTSASALDVKGSLPWSANAGSPPTPVQPGPWVYFTAEEGAAIEALVDRLIPPDPQTPGGKDAGCAVFIDRGQATRNLGRFPIYLIRKRSARTVLVARMIISCATDLWPLALLTSVTRIGYLC
jgi:hypothetical protein